MWKNSEVVEIMQRDISVVSLEPFFFYFVLFEAVWMLVYVWVAGECEAGLVSPSRKDLIWTWLLSFIGWRGGRFIGCYLWSSLFTWWVAENENPPQQKKPKDVATGEEAKRVELWNCSLDFFSSESSHPKLLSETLSVQYLSDEHSRKSSMKK